MTNEMKLFLKNSVKYDILLGIGISIILYLFFSPNIVLIYLFGIGISIINFILSGIMLDKNLNSTSRTFKFMFPISYVLRIVGVAFIGLLFARDVSYLMAYLVGFISHFPITIFSWIRKQKGSE